jgi:hypothetical protein
MPGHRARNSGVSRRQTTSNHGRKLIRPAQRHGRNDRFRRFSPSASPLVGDRGMITQARITEDIKAAGLGVRRGPAAEARRLYEEIGAPARLSEFNPVWQPLLIGEEEPQNEAY